MSRDQAAGKSRDRRSAGGNGGLIPDPCRLIPAIASQPPGRARIFLINLAAGAERETRIAVVVLAVLATIVAMAAGHR
jgi:hypothetical protein